MFRDGDKGKSSKMWQKGKLINFKGCSKRRDLEINTVRDLSQNMKAYSVYPAQLRQ